MDSNEKSSHIPTSFGEMNRKERRRFAKQTKMFKGDDRNAWQLMNRTAQVQERHQARMVRRQDLKVIDDVVGEEEEECQPKPHKAM